MNWEIHTTVGLEVNVVKQKNYHSSAVLVNLVCC